jgi:hypothetical protein
MARLAALTLVLWAALLTGCGGSRAPEDETALDPSERVTVVRVDNRAFLDMTIFVLDGGQRVRLGSAPSNATTELIIPAHLVRSARQLQFLCDPIGSSRTPISDEIFVEPGDRVTLLIPGG